MLFFRRASTGRALFTLTFLFPVLSVAIRLVGAVVKGSFDFEDVSGSLVPVSVVALCAAMVIYLFNRCTRNEAGVRDAVALATVWWSAGISIGVALLAALFL